MEKLKLGRILSGNNITNIMFWRENLCSCILVYKPVVIQPRAFIERIKASLLPNSFESPMSFSQTLVSSRICFEARQGRNMHKTPAQT